MSRISEFQQKIIDLESCIERRDQLIYDLQNDANRYRWLKDQGHLDIWWSVEGSKDRIKNIDEDIDQAIMEQLA